MWALVVGATGMINTWADLLVKYWQFDQLTHAARAVPGTAAARRRRARARCSGRSKRRWQRAPGKKLAFIAFPGTAFSSPHHYTFFMRGNTPLTSRLLQPVLVDAQTAQVTATPELPWYLTALLVSQPLHFGDYGGMPMKIVWALLDIVTIVVLGSGLVLFARRRRTSEVDIDDPLHVGATS